MLSILIPVYNYKVDRLVAELNRQCRQSAIEYEIILCDDASQSKYRQALQSVYINNGIKLYRFDENQGRVAARKKLTELAQYDLCLYIDCDAQINHDHFIDKYLEKANDSDVLVGGHDYMSERPGHPLLLHWKYGRQVEARSLSQRRALPFASFSTFNFLVKKSIITSYWDEMSINQYGHEDTLLGYFFERDGIEIIHVDNPAEHTGLKTSDQFLKDQYSAIHNAFTIIQRFPDLDIKLVKTVKRIEELQCRGLLMMVLAPFQKVLESSLRSKRPSIKLLQIFKLYYALKLTGN